MITNNPGTATSPDPNTVNSLSGFITKLENIFAGIGEMLLASGETVAAAESVTSGFLQFSFSQMKEASTFYKGGMTAYAQEGKVELLRVDDEEASQCNCVSRNIAETMALHVAEVFRSGWSVAVTGYATPVDESGGKLYAYFAIAFKGAVKVSERIDLQSGTQPTVAQLLYSEYILESFRKELEKQRQENREN